MESVINFDNFFEKIYLLVLLMIITTVGYWKLYIHLLFWKNNLKSVI